MIETIAFGNTGHQSTRVIFGAAALGAMNQAKADAVLETLLQYGINHIDTAASYGESELRIGPWMREHRKRFFLATKTGDRSYSGARDSVHRSLERLRVDQVDLIQMHNLVDEKEWETALGAGGALEALVEARAQGLVRFIGVTGHGSQVAAMHRKSLERFAFDSVLFPYNFTMLNIAQYGADAEALIKLCNERGVATQTIKSAARRRWQDASKNPQEPKFSWYQPLRDRDPIRRAVSFVLSRPGLFLNSSSDATILKPILDAASEPAVRPDRAAMEADVKTYAMEPLFIPGVSDTI
ncbi:MAG TPA: aldo/keto reductase [Candidatus Binataceae bacterium]|nr:aldo/keto reductase [Candidatus Binataceae bacterium]